MFGLVRTPAPTRPVLTGASAIPVSTATNAYDLLTEIRALIREEPKRYNQFIWHARVTPLARIIYHGRESTAPACGTIGCVAGWVVTLKEGPDVAYPAVPDRARQILGLSPRQEAELFYRMVPGREGSWRHGLHGRFHIWLFQQQYKAQLKATPV
jgi:hypothetical protein